ncbi:MAG: hypothetical protein JWR32_219 [Mycobacterium sp.]|jgi:hypothetical protein|nr:hypothetical protein [Mycobacterium sp.]
MTELRAGPGGSEHANDHGGPRLVGEDFQREIPEKTTSRTPVLITEQEVRLGTAAALRPQPTKRAWRRQYPPRAGSYLETGLMSREGYRL